MRLLIATLFAFALQPASPALAQFGEGNAAGIQSGHVHLNVTDPELHKRLWVDHFHGEIVEHGPLRALRWPGMLVFLHEQEPSGRSQGAVMDHFGFKVRDVDAILDRWRAAGREVQSEFTGAEGFHNAYVVMPDGVRLELQEDPELTEDVIGYHVHWITPQVEDVLGWYVDAFGLTQRARGRIQTTTDVPGMNMSFGSSEESRPPSRGRAIDRIGFEVENIDSLYERLQSRGVEFQLPLHELPGTGIRHAGFTDPAGVFVELSEGYDQLWDLQ